MGGWVGQILARVAVRTRSINYAWGQTSLGGLRDTSLALRSSLDPYLLFTAFYGAQCLSCDFIGLEKFVLEKQTNYVWLIMPLWMCMSSYSV